MSLKTTATLFFLLFSITCKCQYYGGAAILFKMPYSGLELKKTNFNIVKVNDERIDQSKVGDVYFGVLNHFIYCYVKKGISPTFYKYFKKGMNTTIKGDIPISIDFKKLSMNEKQDEFYSGGRRRKYEIEVEYYIENEHDRVLVFVDSLSKDSIAKVKRYNIETFCLDFFKHSLRKLDDVLKQDSITPLQPVQTENEITQIQDSVPDSTQTNTIAKSQNSLNNNFVVSDSADSEIFAGEIKVKLNGHQQCKFRPKDLNPVVQETICTYLMDKERGTYMIDYKVHSKNNKVISKQITPTSYKQQSVSPYWFITVPVLIISGFAAGYNG